MSGFCGRVALALLLVEVAVGCGGSGQPSGGKPTSGPVSASRCLTYAGPGSWRATCGSPDHEWLLNFERASIFLTRGNGNRVRVYRSNDSCCDYITWVKPHLLLFVNDSRLLRVEPPSRQVALIARFSNFLLSPDSRWIAGWAQTGANDASTVDVLSPDGKTCLVVPHDSHHTDSAAGFTPNSKNVIINRNLFDPGSGIGGRAQEVQFALSTLPHSRCTRGTG